MSPDTISTLAELYNKSSKHSNYQVLASNFDDIIDTSNLKTNSRFEYERLSYIKKHIGFDGKRILDIGGNTGFFTFEAINSGASHVDYFEGNKDHAQFVNMASELLELRDKISVFDRYFCFAEDSLDKKYDVTFILNVLHHIGDDYGDPSQNIMLAKANILRQINFMADYTELMAFQLGFNWKGNRHCCLFQKGTKQEMLEYICTGVSGFWKILAVGIAERKGNNVIYNELCDSNIDRDDSLGEFLNRPLIILKSMKCG